MSETATVPRAASARGRVLLLGPAFVAAVAYVDPGNVAANLTAGARYGYLLLWVLVLANAMAVLVQYQSAKLGLVTGRTLPRSSANGWDARPGWPTGRRPRPSPPRPTWPRWWAVPLRSGCCSGCRCRSAGRSSGSRRWRCWPPPSAPTAVRGPGRRAARRHHGGVPRRASLRPARRWVGAARAGAAVRRCRLGAAGGRHARRHGDAARDLRPLGAGARPARPPRTGPSPRAAAAGHALGRRHRPRRRRGRQRGPAAAGRGRAARRRRHRHPGGRARRARRRARAGGRPRLRRGTARLGAGLHLRRRLRRGDDHGRAAAPPRADAGAAARHPDPGGAAAGRGRRPHLDPGDQPGGAELRHPVRGDPAGAGLGATGR